VTIEDAACGRYALAAVEVQVGPSPTWLAERLTAAGVRPINNIVDVTNYVMLETGHPMHAFDAARLAGPEIRVRPARAGEKITTLDGQERKLDGSILVIADRDRAVAVAGVMGGAATEVSTSTSRIALESAWFRPTAVRAASRRLGLKTEASARFERGADIEAPVRAVERAVALFAAIDARRSDAAISDTYSAPPAPRTVSLRRAHLVRLLGDTVPDPEVERILGRLGFGCAPAGDGWQVDVPTFRVDVAREADLIEEVGRHWGFDRIPAVFPPLRTVPRPTVASIARDRTIRRVLTAGGLQEAVTFTFIEQAAAAPFAADPAALVTIANPLSEKFAVLRPSLLPGLLDALIYSKRRESSDVQLFEAGAVFGLAGERPAVAWVLTGARHRHWSGGESAIGFSDAKGAAELLASAFGVRRASEAADEVPGFVRGRTARLLVGAPSGAIAAGVCGELRPDVAVGRGLSQGDAVFGGELDLSALVLGVPPGARAIDPLPRHPSITRDLSIVIDQRLPAEHVRGTIRANAPATLVSVREFDRYQGKGVPDGRVSLSLRLIFRAADRTLTDHEVQQAIDAIVGALTREHGATLRGA
jgi:phenylalanyl-tRNA synthetase beta chain